jgi:hypothetical protein
MTTTTGTFPGVRIYDLPDLGVVTDTTSFVSEKAGSGRISALALRDYMAGIVAPAPGPGGGLPEAPLDGRYYGRQSAAWQPVAPIVSPALTGTPTAPTAPTGTSNTQLATTGFVSASVSAAGSITEAPSDGGYYSRRNADWALTPSGQSTVASLPQLRAQTSATAEYIYVQGYHGPGDGGGGDYVRGADGADNGGSIIVTGNGTFYLQTYGHPVSVRQFGALGDGTTDDSVACQRALDSSLDVVFPAGPQGDPVTYRLSNSLYPRVGATIRGAGSGSVTLLQTANFTTIWFGTGSPAKFGNFNISGFTIRSAVGGNIGLVSILYSDVTIKDMVFAGCTTASVHIDGGYNILVENCVSIPHFAGNLKAGRYEATSTDTGNYCFYPTFRDCRVQTGEVENPGGSTPGAATPCVSFNRVIGGLIENFIGERLNWPTPNSVVGIQIQGDCQGVKIIGGVTFGASYGVVMFADAASAAAPGYIVVQNHDVDACYTGGISVNGAGAKVCADIIITDCVITAEQLMSCIGITVGTTLRLIVKDNILDQYQFTQTGDGIQISNTNMALITGNILTNLHTAFGMVPSCVNTQFTGNILQGNVNNVVGDMSASGTGTNMIRGNTGAYSWTLPHGTPAIPASGVYIQNTTGLDVMVHVYGGNGVTIGVNGTSTGILFSPLGGEPKGGSAFLPANGTIGVNYATAPTWIWIPV